MKAKKRIENERPIKTNADFNDFIERVRNRDVLLMVGRGFEANSNQDYYNPDFYSYVQSRINDMVGTNGLDFTDLEHDKRFLLNPKNSNESRDIQKCIADIVDENEYSAEEDVSPDLLNLIRTGLFRFVFTTSFSPLVETAMRDFFGQIRVLNIFDKDNRDIDSQEDFDIPTVYYLFGKADATKTRETKRKLFVATDNDALDVLKKWQLDMSNSNLLKYAAEKYILTLGCTQDDWLFRFIWYTLKSGRDNLHRGVIANYAPSDSLAHYLKQNHILIDNDASALSWRILDSLNRVGNNNALWEKPKLKCDVFISYSRSDSKIADALYESLTRKGLDVWYDKKKLCGVHGGLFMDLLRDSIKSATLFVAILSPSITNERYIEHVYRREWEWAKEQKIGLTADCRCYAAVADNYDINALKSIDNDNLGWLSETDNYIFSIESLNFDEWADKLRDRIFEIKKNKISHE